MDAHKLNYDEFNPFDICALSYTPIYRGNEKVECAMCGAKFTPENKGKLCVKICEVAQIGKSAQGIKIRRKIN